jgi:hypothetical protein
VSGTQGQASVEWVGLLAIVAIVAVGLALIAGPPLVAAVRVALVAALSGRPSTPEPVVATAADIADVETTLGARDTALTPDAALLALSRRHGSMRAREIAGAILLEIARGRSPALGRGRTYGGEDAASGEKGIYTEAVTGPVVARWVTVGDHRAAIDARFAHHTDPLQLTLDVISLVPGGKIVGESGEITRVGSQGVRTLIRTIASRAGKGFGAVQDAEGLTGIAAADDDGVPGGMLTGDVVISWPVHVTGTISSPAFPTRTVLPLDYRRRVYLRPSGEDLAVVGMEVAP